MAKVRRVDEWDTPAEEDSAPSPAHGIASYEAAKQVAHIESRAARQQVIQQSMLTAGLVLGSAEAAAIRHAEAPMFSAAKRMAKREHAIFLAEFKEEMTFSRWARAAAISSELR